MTRKGEGSVPASDDQHPPFAALPVLGETGEHHTWDVFGRSDEFGCLNFISERSIVAAAREVRLGRVVNLNLRLNEPQPQFWTDRQPLVHRHTGSRNTRDDVLEHFALQGSTQWDGLRHQRYREYGWYGGRQEPEVDSGTELSIHRWAERGIVGRGVLADVAAWMASRGEPIAPDRRFVIGASLLSAVLADQRTDLHGGDIVLVRTGWLGWYQSMTVVERTAVSDRLNADRRAAQVPGIDPGQETAAWLWDRRVAALALDNPTADALPYVPDEGWAHNRLIPLLGLPLGELWWLDELARICAQQQRFSFLLTSAPLNLPGAAGSPANAYAVL
jgi:kynurenine formamidase